MSSKLLSTGQAARECAVTPDTILKWIRSGRLPARRTAGGHHRIDKRDLDRLIAPTTDGAVGATVLPATEPSTGGQFHYCWEYNGNGKLLDGCRECVVFELRAQRCYEVVKFAPELRHNKLFCKGSCEDCDYYRRVHAKPTNVLVVTDDSGLTAALKSRAETAPFKVEFTDCEYACSAVVESFRPDFVVVDCSLGEQESREICNHLIQDPRIPFVRVILAARDGLFPDSCDREVFARMGKPFDIEDISECIDGSRRARPH